MAEKPPVLIVGAGIGGLTAALALLKRGIDVEVYEQAPELAEVGAGLQISANGTRVLWALGLREALEAVAWRPQGKEIRVWNTGQSWRLFDLGAESEERYGHPYLMFHRADLHGALAAAVRAEKADAIHLGAVCAGVDQDGSRARLTLADGTKAEGGALIGADGVHSVVRQALFGPDRPRFTGCMAWRGVVPTSVLPEEFSRPVGANWVGPGGHVVHYLLRRGELVNFVGVVERADWRVESWSVRGTTEECLADFAGWHEGLRRLIANIATPHKWALMGREPLERWSLGRISLLGDACHPTLPFLAQGAVMAIEDGYVLARCLEGFGDVEVALAAYEAARRERTARIVRGAAENTGRFHSPLLADPATAAEYMDREWSRARVEERYEWLFVYDATTAAI